MMLKLLCVMIGAAVSGATPPTPCEQLILPGLGGFSRAPEVSVRLDLGAAVATGKALARLDDLQLARRLVHDLPGGLMVVGADLGTIRDAVESGHFAGAEPTDERRAAVIRQLGTNPDAAAFARARWTHGITSRDFHSTDELRHLLVVPRDHARLQASGGYVFGGLRSADARFAPLIPWLGHLAQREGSASNFLNLVRASAAPAHIERLARELVRQVGEPKEALIERAAERGGFLVIFKHTAYLGRAEIEDPEAPGTVVALPRGRELGPDEIYAIIPRNSADARDLKPAMLGPNPAPVATSPGFFTVPPPRIVIAQPRTRGAQPTDAPGIQAHRGRKTRNQSPQ